MWILLLVYRLRNWDSEKLSDLSKNTKVDLRSYYKTLYLLYSSNTPFLKFSQGLPWKSSGGPMFKTSPYNPRGAGSIPGWGTKVVHALWPKNQNIK